MNKKFPIPESDYKVMVRCNTYNQRNYITDALNGFAMQKTNFPFCVIVIDDASTDGEQTVIKDFINRECDMNSASLIDSDIMEYIVAPHKTNTSCTFVIMLLKENHWQNGKLMLPYYEPWRNRCLYEALCEGDDYWIADDKLQKQVDYLEGHPDCSMVYTDYESVNKDNIYIRNNKLTPLEGNVADKLIYGNCACTPTVIIRLSMLQGYDIFVNGLDKNMMFGDLSTWLYLSTKGKLHYIDKVTSHYRVLAESASHSSKDKNYLYAFAENLKDFKLYANKALNINADESGIYKTYYYTMLRYTSQHSIADFCKVFPKALFKCPSVFRVNLIGRCLVNLLTFE